MRLAGAVRWFFVNPHRWSVGMAMFAAALLTATLALENALEVEACPLCLRQRYIWLAVGLLSLLGVFVRRFGLVRWGFLPLVAILCFFGVYTAVYQVGLEEGWWLGDCSAMGADTVADLKRMLLAAPIVACSEVSWRFLGLSFAGWNALISASAGIKTLVAIAAADRFG